MRSIFFYFFIFFYFLNNNLNAQQTSNINVSLDSLSGKYTISADKIHWTFSGRIDSNVSSVHHSKGKDEIGFFNKINFTWNDGNKSGEIRWYSNSPVVIFTILLPNGANESLIPFPNFNQFPSELFSFSHKNTYFAYPNFGLTETSTPWLFYDNTGSACIISPASNFIVAQMKGDGKRTISSTVNKEIVSFPRGFKHTTIMVLDNSISTAWENWGLALRNLYHRNYPNKDNDPLLKYYGYWTDNGADYYYNYDTTIGYTSTLLKLKDYYKQNKIPIGYMQLDSWWYEKSAYDVDGTPVSASKNKNLPKGPWNVYGGTMQYKADTFLFPKGLAAFQQELNLPMVTHNRWLDKKSPYSKQYKLSGIMSPDSSFWKSIMAYLKTSGVVGYEQDFLNYIYKESTEMQNSLVVGNQFTDNMANAAKEYGLNLQYCMAMPRYFLQGLKYNNLTTIRTSDDRFDPNKWLDFLFTNRLAYEMGIMPWSDVFKSKELGNMILSVLSSGIVGTGDAIGAESKKNILLACRADAQLVRPDVPIVPLDRIYIETSRHDSLPIIGYTYTKHDKITTNYLFAFCNKSHNRRILRFTPSEIGIKVNSIIYDPLRKKTAKIVSSDTFTDSIPDENYTYYIVAPITKSGIAFLGDIDKITSTGKKRIATIKNENNSMKIKVLFSESEKNVMLHGYYEKKIKTNVGLLQLDSQKHTFMLKVSKPVKKNEVVISLNS